MVKHLYDFIHLNGDNWIEEIQKAPYFIKVRELDNFILLKYDQLNSDMSLPLCQVCRGIILEADELTGDWFVVCYPFNKFFNHGEPHAAEIDWRHAIVNEKIDGSLIKFWADLRGGWHMSTNGSIDAFKAEISDNPYGLTFGDVVERALGCNWLSFCRELNPEYTYMFEVISPDTRVTVPYEYDGLYYLGQRNMNTLKELYYYDDVWENFGVLEPKVYDVCHLEDCVGLVEEFTKDEEGVVVCDRNFNRIKIKSPEYLIAAHCANNGKLGLRTAIRLIREDKVDDFLAYAPMHRIKMELIVSAYEDMIAELIASFAEVKHLCWMSKKDFVEMLNLRDLTKLGYNYSLWKYEHRELRFKDYLNRMTEKSIMRYIKDKAKEAKEELDDE